MGVEIERKFLVASDAWREGRVGVHYAQGYLSRESGRTVRVRVAGDKAFLTVKGPVHDLVRDEFEYAIPVDDARAMMKLCDGPIIDKHRYRVPFGAHVWEVDEFHGDNEGLVVAEVELRDAGEEPALPPWIGDEVTDDRRYYNANLTVHPFQSW